uniref:Tetraspanin n=1 Tax=Hadrurus spadix TaxID=141984 RepID=A0A1W7RAS4_9SCOR
MALQGCYACIKYLVIIFNFLFWLAGIGVLALSIYTYVKASNYVAGSDEIKTLFISLYILMAAGSLMTILGFLGCCGALRESQCMLGSFFFLVLIILIAEIVAGVWAAMNQKEVEDILTNELRRIIQKEYGLNEVANRTIDAIQHDFTCCGASGPSDWKESNFNKNKDGGKITTTEDALRGVQSQFGIYKVPSSCCVNSAECNPNPLQTIGNAVGFDNSIHKDGCVKKLEKAFKNNLTIVAGVGIGLGVIQILGLIFSIILCCAIRNGEGVSYHV